MSENNAAAIAADTLGLQMLEQIVDQFRQLPGFENLTSAQQQVHIEQLDKIVRKLIAEALNVIFRAEYPACVAELGRIVVGKSIVARVDVLKTAESRHELMDRTGQKVVIVMADPDQYYQRMANVKARADQQDLFHDSSQPLGHMGVEEPPTTTDDPPPPTDNSGGESGLDDVMPHHGHDEQPAESVDLVTPSVVVEQLNSCDVVVPQEVADAWSREQLDEAAIWFLAVQNADKAGHAPPLAPEFLRCFIKVPSVDLTEVSLTDSPPDPACEVDKGPAPLEPIDIPDAAIDAEILAGLRMRGITLKAKVVRNWSSSQRVAAISWLQARTTHDKRPEFIPAPTDQDAAA